MKYPTGLGEAQLGPRAPSPAQQVHTPPDPRAAGRPHKHLPTALQALSPPGLGGRPLPTTASHQLHTKDASHTRRKSPWVCDSKGANVSLRHWGAQPQPQPREGPLQPERLPQTTGCSGQPLATDKARWWTAGRLQLHSPRSALGTCTAVGPLLRGGSRFTRPRPAVRTIQSLPVTAKRTQRSLEGITTAAYHHAWSYRVLPTVLPGGWRPRGATQVRVEDKDLRETRRQVAAPRAGPTGSPGTARAPGSQGPAGREQEGEDAAPQAGVGTWASQGQSPCAQPARAAQGP